MTGFDFEIEDKLKTLSEIEKEIRRQVEERLSNYELTMSIVIAVAVAIITVLVIIVFGIWKIRTKVMPRLAGAPKKYRFRKRDKVMFFGRKMLRQVRSFSSRTINAAGLGQGKGRVPMKKKEIIVLAKKFSKILMKKAPSQPRLQMKGPPKSFFEADGPEIVDGDHRIPSEVLYMLRSVRVFGHFEKPLFLELCKHMESMMVPAGGSLFKIGDEDNCIYVVQSGKINVFITEGYAGGYQNTEYLVKEVSTGDSIHSLLSILDFLTGNPTPYKTVSARAVVDTTVLKLPATAFQSLFERFPESLVRVVQVIMVRLQRVTFTALHNYLGLSSELINKHSDVDLKSLSIHAINPELPPGPIKRLRSTVSGTSDTETETRLDQPDRGYNSLSIPGTSDETNSMRRISDFDVACLRAGVTSQNQGVGRQVSDVYKLSKPPKVRNRRQSLPVLRRRRLSEDTSTSMGTHSKIKLRQPGEPSIVESNYSLQDDAIFDLAKKDLVNIMKLKDEHLLDGKMHLHSFKPGTVLTHQGEQDVSLLFIVSGKMSVLQQQVGQVKEIKLFTAIPGEIIGALAVLTGEPSFFTFKAKTELKVVVISKNDFYSLMREQPSVVLNMASTTLNRLTPFVRQIDFALDWMMVESGRALFRQGDYSDSVYIVLTGRLRTVITSQGGKKEMVGEYGRGELVGIVEVLTQHDRVTTGMAIRDTELAKLPSELLNVIKRKYPQVVTRLIHLLGQRIIGSVRSRESLSISDNIPGVENRASVANLATVAVLPASSDVPLTNFTLELQHALKAIGPASRFTSEIVRRWLGAGALDSVNEFRLFSWLGQQEDFHRMILYQCDNTMTRWTKMCIRQADCILIVGLAGKDPKVQELETQMESIDVRAQKELVLLHTEDADYPTGTVEWLNARGWCSSHHHIRCPKRVFSKRSLTKMAEVYDELHKTEPDRMSDICRLARFLTGTSIGLVLGGGGARGFAHCGIIKALQDARIPIDMVGGVSMGAFIGALWCEEANYTRFVQRGREWAMKMRGLLPKVLDLTYPVTSMFKGSSFNEGIEATFKDRQMEDLWIPFFAITTDLTSSQMRVHSHGSLWRYVRASMSLAGYLPPLCDPIDGHLLLDGGYVNNLPADVMRSHGAQSIFAVDVGSIDNTELTNYGDTLSGWWLLWKRWNPWAEPVRVPDMQEIQSRLAYVSCIRQLEIVKNSDYCEYIRPPIDKYGTLQFGSYDEIVDVGYNHGKTMFSSWERGGLISKLFQDKKREERKLNRQSQDVDKLHGVPKLAYFTDLAEMVAKIEQPLSSVSFYEPDADDEDSDVDEVLTDEQLLDNNANAEDYDEEDVDDDDDDEYITEESDNQEDDDMETELPTEHALSGTRLRTAHASGQDYVLPRRLSGYLHKRSHDFN